MRRSRGGCSHPAAGEDGQQHALQLGTIEFVPRYQREPALVAALDERVVLGAALLLDQGQRQVEHLTAREHL